VNILVVVKNRQWLGSLARHLVVPLTFLFIMLFFYPFRQHFEFDVDEGFNVMKAMLIGNGYTLYRDIWSDQPPLLTHILAVVFRIFGYDMNAARILILILSGMLLWGSCQFLRAIGGNSYSFAGAPLIVLLPHFAELSVSVMVGLPALAFAMVSLLALTIWHRRRANLWLVASAVLLSLSLFTKVFTGFLVLLFVAGIVIAESSRSEAISWRDRLRPAILWILVFAGVTFVLVIILVGPANVPQLWETHLAAYETTVYQGYDVKMILKNTPTVMLLSLISLSLLGSLVAIYYKRWLVLYPMAWLVTAFVLLSFHVPVPYHHQPLVTIPAAMLAACAVGEFVRWIPRLYHSHNFLNIQGLICLIIVVGVMGFAATHGRNILKQFNLRSFSISSDVKVPSPKYQLVAKMIQHAPRTHWVVTDSPMYAFRAGLPVPPHLAVISRKRLSTGALNESEILHTIREWKPEQVLIARFKFPSIVNYLEEHYRAIYFQDDKKLYLRGDLRSRD
jgi:hypothetical protein